jgi:hypothetical protein
MAFMRYHQNAAAPSTPRRAIMKGISNSPEIAATIRELRRCFNTQELHPVKKTELALEHPGIEIQCPGFSLLITGHRDDTAAWR